MTFFSVDKLAALCKVDKETVRRWRNRGVNGVKLEAKQLGSRRGVALIFDEVAVRTFMKSNPKYLTKELDQALNQSVEENYVAYKTTSFQSTNMPSDGYVQNILEQQRKDLLQKLNEIDRTLALIKGEKQDGHKE